MRRIVSLVPSMTETICRLGAGRLLVGVTRYCTEPAGELQHVPRIGGTKNPELEQIAALQPDLVVVNGEENRAEHIAWLRQRSPVLEHLPKTVLQAADAVRDLACALDRLDAAQPLLSAIDAQIEAAEAASRRHALVRVFYAIWKRPWMSVNGDTYIHDVLTRAGAINVCAAAMARYPDVDPALVRDAGAQLVLLSSEPYAFADADCTAVISAATFGEQVQVLLCDGRDYCWHGARTAEGLGRAVALLEPLRA